MTEDQLKEKYGSTIPMLMNYMHLGIISRSFMLNNHQDTLIQLSEKGTLSKEEELTEFLIYKELFERVCVAIEDFTIISNALSLELSDFQKNILKQPNVEKILNSFNAEMLDKILKYRDISCLASDEQELITSIRNRNTTYILNFVNQLKNFVAYHWVIYTKIKHGNTLFQPYKKINIRNIATFVAPVVYNSKQPEKTKVLMLSLPIYIKLQTIFNSLLNLMYNFCKENYDYICRSENGRFLGVCYADTTTEERDQLEKIHSKYLLQVMNYDISMTIEGSIDNRIIDEILEVYREFNIGFT